MKSLFLVPVAGLLVAACVTQPRQSAPYVAPAECASKDECDVLWSAALQWVQSNCGMRIQNASEMMIQTHKSGDYADTHLGCEVTKMALGGGRYQIVPHFWVNNAFMAGSASEGMNQFNAYIRRKRPPPPMPPSDLSRKTPGPGERLCILPSGATFTTKRECNGVDLEAVEIQAEASR